MFRLNNDTNLGKDIVKSVIHESNYEILKIGDINDKVYKAKFGNYLVTCWSKFDVIRHIPRNISDCTFQTAAKTLH